MTSFKSTIAQEQCSVCAPTVLILRQINLKLTFLSMQLSVKHLTLFCVIYFAICPAKCEWMYLGAASLGSYGLNDASHQQLQQQQQPLENVTTASPEEIFCRGLSGLVEEKTQICDDNPEAVKCLRNGALLGFLECQFQFQNERWNCSIGSSNQSILRQIVQQGTRETAFIHAVATSGVVHTVTMACSTGNLTDCSCDTEGQSRSTDEGWQWGGCSDNVNYGVWFAETFVDANERGQQQDGGENDDLDSLDGKKNIKILVNLHNNEVGRRTVTSLMAHKCRCHGVSGSCAVRTCWRALPDFRKVGNQLKEKYETSVEISPSLKPTAAVLRRREKRKRREPISQTELVFVERSPNYCRHDPSRGIFGTKGRQCKKTSSGPDSCHSLCCGRGYNTQVVRTMERCQCKFIWCCEVKCKTCETIYDIHTCK